MRPDDCLDQDCNEVRERERLEARVKELEAAAACPSMLDFQDGGMRYTQKEQGALREGGPPLEA